MRNLTESEVETIARRKLASLDVDVSVISYIEYRDDELALWPNEWCVAFEVPEGDPGYCFVIVDDESGLAEIPEQF